MSKLKTFGTAAAVAALMATGASAATLSYVGTGQTQLLAGNDLGLGLNGMTIDYISGDQKTNSNGLSVSGPAKITFTYLGYEASNTNYAADILGAFFQNGVTAVGATYTATQAAGGLIDFLFGTSDPLSAQGTIANNGVGNPASPDFAIGYQWLSATSYLVLFDDIASGDRDFDDIGVRIDVAPIPVPAAGFLLLGGLGVLGALSRRRKAA